MSDVMEHMHFMACFKHHKSFVVDPVYLWTLESGVITKRNESELFIQKEAHLHKKCKLVHKVT